MEPEHTLRSHHVVVFYDDNAELIDAVDSFLRDEDAARVVVATPEHRAAFRARIPDLIEADAETLLGSFCQDGVIHPERFAAAVQNLVGDAVASGRPVRIFGELVTLLWQRNLVSQAIEVEKLWETLIDGVPCTLLCAYPSWLVLDHDDPSVVNEVTCKHPGVSLRAFPASPQSIRATRLFVAECIGDAFPGRDVVLLIASELATNAVQHAASSFVVEVRCADGAVRVAVRDQAPAEIGAHDALNDEESGRGLSLVDALSAEWGVRPTPRGKVVWAEVRA